MFFVGDNMMWYLIRLDKAIRPPCDDNAIHPQLTVAADFFVNYTGGSAEII